MYDYDIEIILQRLLDYFDLDNMSQLADKLSVSQPTISKWKSRSSILPIKKICRELGIYNEIFGDLNSNNNNFQNSKNNVAQIFGGENQNNYNTDTKSNLTIDENILKLIEIMYSYASKHNKIDELKTDLSTLLPKYM